MEFVTVLGRVSFFSLCSQIVPFRAPGSWWSEWRRRGARDVQVPVALSVDGPAPLRVVRPIVELLEGDPASLQVVPHHVERDRVVVDLGLPVGVPRCAGHERSRTDCTPTTGPGDHLRSTPLPTRAGASGGEVLILRPMTVEVRVGGRTTAINAHLLDNGSTPGPDKRFPRNAQEGHRRCRRRTPNWAFPHVHVCPLSCTFVSICEAMATGGSVNQITGVFNSAPRKLDPPGGVVCCYLSMGDPGRGVGPGRPPLAVADVDTGSRRC